MYAVREVGTEKYLLARKHSHSWGNLETIGYGRTPRLHNSERGAKNAATAWKQGKYSYDNEDGDWSIRKIPERLSIVLEVVPIIVSDVQPTQGEPNDHNEQCALI